MRRNNLKCRSCLLPVLLLGFSPASAGGQDLATALHMNSKASAFPDRQAKERPLVSFLQDLEERYEVRFSYEDRLIERLQVRGISMDEFGRQDFEPALEAVLRPLNLQVKKLREGYYVIRMRSRKTGEGIRLSALPLRSAPSARHRFSPERASAGERQVNVTGRVTDEQGAGLPGVSVMLKGSAAGTATDEDGSYQLQVPDGQAGGTLVFSLMGFLTREVPLERRTRLDVVLEEDLAALEEVIVVGYGNQERRNVTSAVSTISGDAIKDLPVTSMDQKLSGQVAGVQVSQVTGMPGGAPVVRIRGSGSIGAGDDPLFVIDGYPVSNDYNKFSNPLSLFSPDDIESITVLKDASATAIYGSRGANGVILIETKKAKSGASSLEVNAYAGIQYNQKGSLPDMMTAEEFARWRVEHRQDMAAFNGQPFDEADTPEEYRDPAALGRGTDWVDAMTRQAPMQNYNITYTKGKDDLRVMLSLGYFNQQGVLRNSAFERFSFRANIDGNIGNKISMGLNFAPNYNIRDLTDPEGHFDNALLTQALLNSPLPPVRQEDGSYTPSVTSTDAFENANPVNMLVNTNDSRSNARALTNLYANWEIIPGLNFKSTFNVDWRNDKRNYFVPSYVGGFRSPPPQVATGQYYTGNILNLLNENTLNYDKSFGEHDLSLLLGYTVQQEKGEFGRFNGTEYPDDEIQTLNAAAVITGNSTVQEWRMLSYLGRVNYSYKGRYLLSAVIRRDGSSRFGYNDRWGTFPSVSGAWRVSDEEFFRNDGFIDELKLRASYGLSGNNNIGNYTFIPDIVNAHYVFSDNLASGSRLNSLANFNLGWESSRQLDIGLDLSLLKGRIYFIGEYYTRNTKDMLQTIDIPIVSGFGNAITNIGEVSNKGWEFTLNTKNFTGDFRWDTDFNISFNRNEILDLGNKREIFSGNVSSSISVVGEPMGVFYGYLFDGIFQSQEELDQHAHEPGQVPGTVRYVDVNGDGTINTEDRAIMGNPHPDFIFGLTNRFHWKNFDLSVLLNGAYGGQVLDLYKRFTTNLDGVFNVEREVMNRWRSPEQPGDGKIPTTVASTPLAREINSLWVKDASYMTVRNITLGYSFRTNFSSQIRVYLSGQNLFVLSPYDGNPEVNINGNNSLAQGVNYTGYPVAATFTLGANVRF